MSYEDRTTCNHKRRPPANAGPMLLTATESESSKPLNRAFHSTHRPRYSNKTHVGNVVIKHYCESKSLTQWHLANKIPTLTSMSSPTPFQNCSEFRRWRQTGDTRSQQSPPLLPSPPWTRGRGQGADDGLEHPQVAFQGWRRDSIPSAKCESVPRELHVKGVTAHTQPPKERRL